MLLQVATNNVYFIAVTNHTYIYSKNVMLLQKQYSCVGYTTKLLGL